MALVKIDVESAGEPGPAPTLTTWLAEGNSGSAAVAMQFVIRVASALGDAHQRGVHHGALNPDMVALDGATATEPGNPRLMGLRRARMQSLRREEVSADIAGLGQIAQRLLAPAPPGRPLRHIPLGRRAVTAVIEAAMDRQEGVFLFESALDFVAALEAAAVADAGAALRPDPALSALRGQRRRRRVLKVVAGAAVACLAMLAVSRATAGTAQVGRAAPAAHSTAG
jgi:hypothetical protein